MTDSPPRRITGSGRPQGTAPPLLSGPPPHAENVSCNQEQVGTRCQSLTVIGTERRYTRPKHQAPYVPVRCETCGKEFWSAWTNVRRGLAGCVWCAGMIRRVPPWLDRRLTAQKQRCTNPNDPSYRNYGGRGIEFRFPSVLEAGLWWLENFPEIDRSMELDRIDNDGHYEPGNLRLATRRTQINNRRNTVLSDYDPDYWPYAEPTVRRLLGSGLSREQVIERAERAVRERRKGWRRIEQRLGSMTYSMPDHVIVSPYRGGSSTTASPSATPEARALW